MATILPCPLDDLHTQRCILPCSLMTSLGHNKSQLNQVAEVTDGNTCYLCTLWPREDDGPYSHIDGIVSRDLECERISATLDRKSGLLETDVKLLQTTKVESITVTLIVADVSDVTRLKSQTKLLSTIVKDILYGMYIAPPYTVSCEHSRIGRLHGVHAVIIDNTAPFCEASLFDDDIIVTVDKVISKDRYVHQRSHAKRPLGGVRVQHTLLKEMLDMIFDYDSSSSIPFSYLTKCALLHGPPGCGKTSLVKQVARECNSYLMCLNGSEILGSLPGESEENLRSYFHKGKLATLEGPVVLFIDEIDALCPKQKVSSASHDVRVLSQLASLIDNLDCEKLAVIGATNRPGSLDNMLRRAGRFEKEIVFGIPTMQERRDILDKVLLSFKGAADVDVDELAESTPGYVGADLRSVCEQACYMALTADETESGETATAQVSMAHFRKVLHGTTPTSQRGSDILVDYKSVKWEDIGGLQSVKQQLQQAVEWPLKHPEAFHRLGLPTPKGILLYGPPGCAKTTLVRAAATSCHVTFLSVSGAQLMSPYVGDSERKISEVFRLARAGAPTILFIDEIDSVIGSRSKGKASNAHDRLLSTLLNEMDGVGLKREYSGINRSERMAVGENGESPSEKNVEGVNNKDVLVVAATNRPDLLDDALIRPGRIDRIIYVPPPDEEARLEILKIHSKKTPMRDVDLHKLASETETFTGADLENLCREAALLAITEDGFEVDAVCSHHFKKTLDSMSPSLSEEQLSVYKHMQYQK